MFLGVIVFAGLSGVAAYACATPDQPVRVIKLAAVDWDPAREIGLFTATMNAMVTVGSTGDVIGVRLPKSSGDKTFDQAVMQAARQSTYAPQIKDCKPITGSLLVQFTWRPD